MDPRAPHEGHRPERYAGPVAVVSVVLYNVLARLGWEIGGVFLPDLIR